ncbi:hypothetical protein [Phosphitispora fastidiosa]|uniref:hypothetical protein n=1 Tax=Phosphitispora fastidiosa TaxID=2837202 RepID=UPI001E5A900E|nr:hypothetical protein [Phosphitispora fastidiosa]MBU7008204.1 hypothetical protein [Phosphitispora fastidiosa]
MRRYLCISLIIFLLLPSWSWAAQNNQEVSLIDPQVLNDVKGLQLAGKQTVITNNGKSVKLTGLYRFQNTGEDVVVLLGLPESLKKLSTGFDTELKPENVKFVAGGSLQKAKTAEKSKTISGKELKGAWMTWEVPAKAKTVVEIRLIYSIDKIPFGSSVQIQYLPAAEPSPSPNLKSVRTVMDLGPFSPAEVTELQPEGYKLNPASVVWDSSVNSPDSGTTEGEESYIIRLDNSLRTAYAKYFKGEDKKALDEAVSLLAARNFKEAAAKLKPLSGKQGFNAEQREYLSFATAAVDLGQKDYPAVIDDLKAVDPDKLQLSEDQTVFKGLYFYYLTQAYKDSGKFDELQDLADRGRKAGLSSLMQEWLGVTSKRMQNVENIMEGKSPDTPVYGSDNIDGITVWVIFLVVLLAAGAGGAWYSRKKKK